MNEFERYQVLCVVDTQEQFQEIKKQFQDSTNLRFIQCRADTDCRFLLRTLNIDIVITDTNSRYDVESFCESLEKYSAVSPAIIFQSNFSKIYDCAYQATKENLEEIVFQLLPVYFQKSA